MEFPNRRIIELIVKDIDGTANAEEAAELGRWVTEDPEHGRTLERFRAGDWQRGIESFRKATERSDEAERIVMARVTDAMSAKKEGQDDRPVRRIWGWRAVAACVVLAVAGGVYWLHSDRWRTAAAAINDRPTLAPGRNQATLILTDKKVIVLDGRHTGSVARQGNAVVHMPDSTLLTYTVQSLNHKPASGPGELEYNTVITPRAGQYKLQLSDGTTVFLNAQSSLRFPVEFGSEERRVELVGEGYFEVARDAARPFHVDLGRGRKITVLGTHFDVRDYTDDSVASATLLEGAIRVESGNRSVLLSPDHEALLQPDGRVTVEADERPGASIAWTHNMFVFYNARVDDVLRQLSRWYDVDVVLQGTSPETLVTVSSNRSVSAWELLDALKEITGLKYKIEGKKIIVLP